MEVITTCVNLEKYLCEAIVFEIASLLNGREFIEWIIMNHVILKDKNGKKWSDKINKLIEERKDSIVTLWKLIYINPTKSHVDYNDKSEQVEKYKISRGVEKRQLEVVEKCIPSEFMCLIRKVRNDINTRYGYIADSVGNVNIYYSENKKGIKCLRFSLHIHSVKYTGFDNYTSMGCSFFGRMKDGEIDGIVTQGNTFFNSQKDELTSYCSKFTVDKGKIRIVKPYCAKSYRAFPLSMREKQEYGDLKMNEEWCL